MLMFCLTLLVNKMFTESVNFSFKNPDALKDTSTILKQRNRIVFVVVSGASTELKIIIRFYND